MTLVSCINEASTDEEVSNIANERRSPHTLSQLNVLGVVLIQKHYRFKESE